MVMVVSPWSKGGGIGFRSGGEILLHYTLKPIPPEGLYRFAGEDPPKMTLPGSYPKVVRSLGDFFGSHAVEVQVLLLGEAPPRRLNEH